MLDATTRAADWMGLRFNAKKCAALHIDGSKRDSVQTTGFQIQGEPVIPLAEGQAYQHLGTPTGFRVRQTPKDTIQEILQDAAKIDASLLAPWQKINALNTFLIPCISFVLRGSAVAKVPLNKVDKIIQQLVKKWLFLPQRASNELVYVAHRHGGANVPRMGDPRDIAVITHAFRLLTCPNSMVRNIAANALHDATKKRIGRAPSNQDTTTFLSSSLDGEFGMARCDIASLWSCASNATRRLGKRISYRWEWCEERQELGVLVPQIRSDDNTIVTLSARGMLERTLKAAIYSLYMETLKCKPDEGKAFGLTSKWDASNHFLAGGGFTHLADWWFIHRARLNCVPLNGAIRHGNRDKRCRKCGYSNETLHHVLCSCKPHSRAWQLHHNAIQNCLVKAIAPCLGEVAVNTAIPGTDSQLRPDVVVTD
ncbi:ubiquitin-conjugating enzyme E2 E3 isoform X1 [Caretta caretta]|uniref:ubiquitin-conjugating enzyme E2 E3 isoform X1 n=1 Tax=Caretta caretta TaxID=8467 RepID=UPI003F4C68B4